MSQLTFHSSNKWIVRTFSACRTKQNMSRLVLSKPVGWLHLNFPLEIIHVWQLYHSSLSSSLALLSLSLVHILSIFFILPSCFFAPYFAPSSYQVLISSSSAVYLSVCHTIISYSRPNPRLQYSSPLPYLASLSPLPFLFPLLFKRDYIPNCSTLTRINFIGVQKL